jgi:hypothetical protein
MSVTIACVGESDLNKVCLSQSCFVSEKIAPCQLKVKINGLPYRSTTKGYITYVKLLKLNHFISKPILS